MSWVDANASLGRYAGTAAAISQKLKELCEYLQQSPYSLSEAHIDTQSKRELIGIRCAKDLHRMFEPIMVCLTPMSFVLGVDFKTRFLFECMLQALRLESDGDYPSAAVLEELKSYLQEIIRGLELIASRSMNGPEKSSFCLKLRPLAQAAQAKSATINTLYRSLEPRPLSA